MDSASSGATRLYGVRAAPHLSPNRQIQTRTRGPLLPSAAGEQGAMQKLSLIAKVFIASIVTTGAVVLVSSLVHWKSSQPVELFVLLTMTVIASRLKVKLPGINGTMSVNVPFLLIVAVRLS